MSDSNTRKRRSKAAFPIGLVLIIFAVFGIVCAVIFGIKGISALTDNPEKKAEYEKMLIPVVMYDPEMFDDVINADRNVLTNCAVWAVIKDEDIYPGKYVTDDSGNVVIPQEEVENKFIELFGTEAKPLHVGTKGYYNEFTYVEQSKSYLIASAGSVPIYTPRVVDISKSSNTIILTVGYLASDRWAQDTRGNFISPEPDKYVKFTLRENADGWFISAMQATDAPDRVISTMPVTTEAPPADIEDEITTAFTTVAETDENGSAIESDTTDTED